MVVSVTASTSNGRDLTVQELDVVNEACDIAVELNEAREKVLFLYNISCYPMSNQECLFWHQTSRLYWEVPLLQD
jgi:hypothetical protein